MVPEAAARRARVRTRPENAPVSSRREHRKRPSPAELSNEDLLATLDRLARYESRVTAVLVAHLAELDRRELHTAAGFRSLHEYCTERLHLSDHEAYLRITAAQMVGKHPRIQEVLGGGNSV